MNPLLETFIAQYKKSKGKEKMHDQNSIDKDKWDRSKTLLLESLYEPNTKLRGCAHNQGCFDELMALKH